MRILVVGLPKSGTTILTYRIAAALDGVAIDFEPAGGPDPTLVDHAGPVVTKKLVGAQTDTLADFADHDLRIWICRDPRDFLVSQTLYRWHRERPPEPEDRAGFERILDRQRAKEADPRSVPFLQLEPADYQATFDNVADLWRREGDDSWLLYPYERMVVGDYEPLERYLGFRVEPEATVADGLQRVVRSKGSGDWRHWFTRRDVGHFGAGGLRHYMDTFGYDHGDWELDPDPHIDARHGSDYMIRLFDDHDRAERRVGDLVDEPPPRPPRRVLDRLLGRSR